MDGWFSGLVAAKMEDMIINFTKNLMRTNMSNYNRKTHQTGGDNETNDQNYFEKLENNDKQEHQEENDGNSHLNKMTHNLLQEVNQMKMENEKWKNALLLEKIKQTNSLITESKCNETVQIKCCHKEKNINETTEREKEKLQLQEAKLRVLMEENEKMNKRNRRFEQELVFLHKQLTDMKCKFNTQESINKEATEKLASENEELKLQNKVQEKEYKEKENQRINNLMEYKTKYEEMECLKEKMIKDLSQSNVYLAEKLSKTRKAAQQFKNSKINLRQKYSISTFS